MAMENKRIIQLSTERLTLNGDDYVMVDSETDGSAKYRLDRLKETDTTLSVSGMAADAAATGQAISDEAEARSDADTALGNDVDDLKSALTLYEQGQISLAGIIAGESVDTTDGSIIVDAETWGRTDYIPVSKYVKLTIEAPVRGSLYNCFYDANKGFISSFMYTSSSPKNEIDVPATAAYVIFTNTVAAMPTVKVSFLEKQEKDIQQLQDNSALFSIGYLQKNTIKDVFINPNNGNVSKYNTWDASDFIPISNDVLCVYAPEYCAYNAYYDASKNYISGVELYPASYKGKLQPVYLYPPAAAKFIRISNVASVYANTNILNTPSMEYVQAYDGYEVVKLVSVTASTAKEYTMPVNFHAGAALEITIAEYSTSYNGNYYIDFYKSDNTVFKTFEFSSSVVNKCVIHEECVKVGFRFAASGISTNGNIIIAIKISREECEPARIVKIEAPYYYQYTSYNINFKFSSLTYFYNGVLETIDLDTGIIASEFNESTFDRNWGHNVVARYINENGAIVLNPILGKVRYLGNKENAKKNDLVLIERSRDGNLTGAYIDYYLNYIHNDNGHASFDKIPYDVRKSIDEIEDFSILPDASYEDFSFVWLSDNHTETFDNYEAETTDLTSHAAMKIFNDLNVDTIINSGDTVITDYTNADSAIPTMRRYFEIIPRDLQIYCQGNHDRGIKNPPISQSSFFNLCYRGILKDGEAVFGNPPATYYYKDFDKNKIRVVVLDMYDCPQSEQYHYDYYAGYRQDQLKWLHDTALRVPSQWAVIVVTHSAPVSIEEGMTYNSGPNINADVLRAILTDYKNGTSRSINTGEGDYHVEFQCDFSDQGARDLIGLFAGHCHTDNIVKLYGINYVSIACGYIDVQLYAGADSRTEDLGTRVQNTFSAICIDYVNVDRENRTVTLKRFGFGSDRSFTY